MSQFSQNEGFLVPKPKGSELVPFQGNGKVVIKEGRKEIILEEEEHIKNLEKIMNRDFFPILHFVNNQENYSDRDLSTNLSTAETGIENPEIENLTLNQYTAKYNSEDNRAF